MVNPAVRHSFRCNWLDAGVTHCSNFCRFMQVFFVRDGIKFPDLIRCLRPNPKNHLQEGWRILDFLSHHPESIFIVGHCCLHVCILGSTASIE